MTIKKKKWSVYVVKCKDGTLYCGATNDMKARINAHNKGQGARYTRGRTPVKLAFTKKIGTKSDALRTEAILKRLTRAQKLDLLKR